MSYVEERHPWSVFDGVKTIAVDPEPLMADISAAIAALEYARASHSPPKSGRKSYDGRMADEAYKAGVAVALPPERASAVAKIPSLISITSQQHEESV